MSEHHDPGDDASGRIRSRDGTPIAYHTTGAGAGVIVVPGVLSRAKDYAAFANALGQSFAVHTIERRGRGLSGPQGGRYGMERECEDVAAVQEATGSDLIFGHSFGGLIALESAMAARPFKKIAVYEPGVSVNGSISTDWSPAYLLALKGGRPLEAFAQFSIASGPIGARRLPVWAMKLLLPRVLSAEALEGKLSLLSENLREHEVIVGLNDAYAGYRGIKGEVLLLTGEKSNLPWLAAAVAVLQETVPRLTVKRLPKLDHFGPERSGPREVAAQVSQFFHAKTD